MRRKALTCTLVRSTSRCLVAFRSGLCHGCVMSTAEDAALDACRDGGTLEGSILHMDTRYAELPPAAQARIYSPETARRSPGPTSHGNPSIDWMVCSMALWLTVDVIEPGRTDLDIRTFGSGVYS